MRKRLIRFAIVCLVVVQIPFALIGLTVTLGLIHGSPNHVVQAYGALERALHSWSRPSSSVTPADPLRTSPPSAVPLPEDIARSDTADSVRIEPLPSVRVNPDLPRKDIDGLPAFHASSEIGRRLFGIPGLAVDYVSVPERLRTSQPDNVVELRFRSASAPRVLLLAGRVGLSWYLTDPLPESLEAVFVAAPDDSVAQIIGRLPERVPVMRLKLQRSATPFLNSATPDCERRRSRQRMICKEVRLDRESGQYRSALELVEQAAHAHLGLPLASVSSATAYGTDMAVMVPEEIVDETVRARAREVVAEYAAFLEAQKRDREVLLSYRRRWIEDRRKSVFDELARHPPIHKEKIVPVRPRISIVSAQRGGRPHAGPIRSKPVTTYEEFRAIQEGKVGVISVQVEAKEPTVLVATAASQVDWHFKFAANARILAVHIEGTGAPTITGVPRHIPLVVRSTDYGDSDVAGWIGNVADRPHENARAKNSRDHVERLLHEYNGSKATLISDGRLSFVRVVTSGQTNTGP